MPITRKRKKNNRLLNRKNSNISINLFTKNAEINKQPTYLNTIRNMSFKLSTSYASDISKVKSCVSVFNLLGRILGSSKYQSGFGSLNSYGGFWPMLHSVISGLKKPMIHRPLGIGQNIYYVGTTQQWWAKLFSSTQAITGSLAIYGSFVPIAANLSVEINNMIKSGINSVTGAKPAARRILSGLSVVKSLVVVIVLLGGYISYIGENGKAELQGLYYYYVILQALYEVLMKDKIEPIVNFLIRPIGYFKQIAHKLYNGIICPEIEQINLNINSK